MRLVLYVGLVACLGLASSAPLDVEEDTTGAVDTKPPQLVMLTFDDAVTVVNFPTYKDLTKKRGASGCRIQATFFVSHEYTNYQLVHELHRNGHEIAVHSITHFSNTDFWKQQDEAYWRSELQGQREIISKFADIPIDEIKGVRLPFLQSSGNATFQAMHTDNFLYDSSMPTLQTNPPLKPYTLDNGYNQDCQIEPCPTGKFPGLWLIPLVALTRKSVDASGAPMENSCSMADACIPAPLTVEDTLEYLKSNFLRHYESNRAPFPLFLHQAWLQDANRYEGYMQFVDWIRAKDDVHLVSVQEVVNYMKNPVSASEYKPTHCVDRPPKTNCMSKAGFFGRSCEYKDLAQFWGGSRYMTICGDVCPENYPWVGNPMGA
jgi:peptidoglycan/xylan/chitin deacetylase (PgdA/CDA1 family)